MTEAASAVRWLLEQAEPEARRVAVGQIAKVADPEATELLLGALGDDDWRVRKEAAAAAPSLASRSGVVAALVATLEEVVNIGLRNAAVEALVAIGPDAVGATVEAMGRLGQDARKLAVEVLGGVADARGVAALTRALSDEDPNVRIAAAEALGNAALAGEDAREVAISALVATLPTVDTFFKIATLDSLARLEAHLPWSVFEPHVGDPLLRRYAIAAAAGSSEPDALAALAGAVGDPSPTISREALVALGDRLAAEHGSPGVLEVARAALFAAKGGVAAARRAALDAEDGRARGGALLVLGLVQDVADVPALVEALGDDEVAERAELAFRLFGGAAARALVDAARFAEPAVRAAALGLLSSLEGAEVSAVRDALHEALGAGSLEVVAAALEALGPVGDASDLPRVAGYLAHPDARVAATAVNALSELAARHAEAARALLRHAGTEDPLALGCILLGAIASTRALGTDDVRLLERALGHADPHVRRAAVDALAQAGGEAAADAVVFALTDEEREVNLAAVRALGRLGRAGPLADLVAEPRDPLLAATALRALGDVAPERALDAARRLAAHADPAHATAAVEAVGHLAGMPGASPSLVAACEDVLFASLEHRELEVVKLALSLAGDRPGARALSRLGLCLDHASWEVRRLAAELLAEERSPAAQALLRARYERERDPLVREAIAAAFTVRPPSDGARGSERG